MTRTTSSWATRFSQRHRRRKRQLEGRRIFRHKSRIVEPLEPRLMLTVASDPDQLLPTGDVPLAVELGPINTDASVDLVTLSADGQLTVAFNDGADHWQDVTTTDLLLGPLVGMQLAPVDRDAYQDLILQGPDSIHIALGDGTGKFTLHSTSLA